MRNYLLGDSQVEIADPKLVRLELGQFLGHFCHNFNFLKRGKVIFKERERRR